MLLQFFLDGCVLFCITASKFSYKRAESMGLTLRR